MRQEGQSHEGQLYEGAYGGCNTNGFGNSDYFAYEPHAWWLRLSKDTIISVALLAPAGLLASFGVVSVSGVRARATFALAWAGLYQRRPPLYWWSSLPLPRLLSVSTPVLKMALG